MRWVGAVTEWLRGVLRKERMEAELDEEVRFHLDMEAEKLVRSGMPPGEARRRALLAFGGVDRFVEQTREARGSRPLEDLLQDGRFAFRQMRRNPAFSLVTALTVGLGVGATLLGFLIVEAVILRPLPYPEADRLVRIQETNRTGDPYSMSAPNFLDVAASARSLRDLVAFSQRSMSLLGGAEPYQARGMAVTPGYLELLGGAPTQGRGFAGSDAPMAAEGSVVVLSHGLWARIFGSDPAVLGTSLTVDGTPRTVVGIAPAGFPALAQEELWVPFGPDPDYPRGDHRLEAIGRLVGGSDLEAVREELGLLAERLGAVYPASNEGWGFRVVSFRDWLIGPDARRSSIVLWGAGGLLLLLACASVSALLLSRVSTRQREVALRSALGARTARIVRQLLVEGIVLAVGGAVVGLGLTAVLVPWLRDAAPGALPRIDGLTLDSRALAFALVTTLGASILFSLAPAVHAVRGTLFRTLQASARTTAGGGHRLHRALVAGQMALAVVLLVGAGLLGSTLLQLSRVDPGFDAADVLSVRIAPRADRYPAGQRPVGLFYEDVLQRIRAIPGVQAAGAYNVWPFVGPRPANQVAADGRAESPEDFVEIQWRAVTPGFFETMGIGLEGGRYLDAADGAWDPFVAAADAGAPMPLPVVISAPLARRLWPGEVAVGRHIVWNRPQGDLLEVVGVVEPFRDVDLATVPAPLVFLPNGLVGMRELTLLVRTSPGDTGMEAAVRAAIWSVDRDTPVPEMTPLQAALDRERAGARLNLGLMGALALAALLLATLSLYGVVSYATEQRTREIGIRVALGASAPKVVWPIVAQSLQTVVVGALAGVVGSLVLSRYLGSLLYDVEPTDPATHLVVIVTLGFAAAVASYLPARRAGAADPQRALAAE